MKVLITGGAGFIGSHLARRLVESGDEVSVIDNLSTGRLENISDLQEKKNFRFILDTVRNPEMMHVLVEQCDVVYHLAAAVGVQLIVDSPVKTIETNIHGTEVVLEVANKFGKKVLIASTSEVYGKSDKVPFGEDDDIILGSTRFSRWSYACSKAIDEFLGLAYYEQYKLPVTVVRLFNTVGPMQTGRYGMVIPRFVESALEGRDICVYGSGEQTRCFCYVGDVVNALVGLVKNEDKAGKVYNVGTTEEISISGLADMIIEMCGSKSKKRFLSYEEAYGKPFDDMMRRVPDISRIGEAIDWKPGYDLKKTLGEIIEHHKSLR